jgi:hypothetical protein
MYILHIANFLDYKIVKETRSNSFAKIAQLAIIFIIRLICLLCDLIIPKRSNARYLQKRS